MIARHDEPDPVIHRYTRAEAIADGVLMDLTQWAAETGFTVPVACTRSVWEQWVVPPEGTRELGQSERGRGHDLLFMLFVAIRGAGNRRELQYEVIFMDARRRHRIVKLKAICGPGDEGEPTITIMLPDED